jgi:hypothetical protein
MKTQSKMLFKFVILLVLIAAGTIVSNVKAIIPPCCEISPVPGCLKVICKRGPCCRPPPYSNDDTT